MLHSFKKDKAPFILYKQGTIFHPQIYTFVCFFLQNDINFPQSVTNTDTLLLKQNMEHTSKSSLH